MKSKYKDILIAVIKKHVPACSIYLYGSRAKGTNDPASDIDLAIDAGHKLDLSVLFAISGEIKDTDIPFFVDVIDLNGVSQEFRQSIGKELMLWTK